MVSCQKGRTRHAYAWQIGPFWQDTHEVHKQFQWMLAPCLTLRTRWRFCENREWSFWPWVVCAKIVSEWNINTTLFDINMFWDMDNPISLVCTFSLSWEWSSCMYRLKYASIQNMFDFRLCNCDLFAKLMKCSFEQIHCYCYNFFIDSMKMCQWMLRVSDKYDSRVKLKIERSLPDAMPFQPKILATYWWVSARKM